MCQSWHLLSSSLLLSCMHMVLVEANVILVLVLELLDEVVVRWLSRSSPSK